MNPVHGQLAANRDRTHRVEKGEGKAHTSEKSDCIMQKGGLLASKSPLRLFINVTCSGDASFVLPFVYRDATLWFAFSVERIIQGLSLPVL